MIERIFDRARYRRCARLGKDGAGYAKEKSENPQGCILVYGESRVPIALCLEVQSGELPSLEFIGIQRVTVAA